MKDREIGELSINVSNNIAFLYFPKNFTKDLTKYFDDKENYESQSYTILTKESKYNLNFECFLICFYYNLLNL